MNAEEIRIKSTKFVKGIIGSDEILFDGVPQIAFVGRSNVGKSSVINALLGQKVAYPSSTPGKTSEINFFEVTLGEDARKAYFVDLPGYGFAKRSPKENEKFRKRIIWYLAESNAPKPHYVVLIVDAVVGLTDLDRDMLDILKNEDHNIILLANKIDKLGQSERVKNIRAIEEEVPETKILPFSAKKKKGVEELQKILLK